RIEHVGAEAGFGGMSAPSVSVSEERVKPAVDVMSRFEIVKELDMAEARLKRIGRESRGVECFAVVAGQRSEAVLCHPPTLRIENDGLDGQSRLGGGHWRWQHDCRVAFPRKNSRREDVALGEILAQSCKCGIRRQIGALDIGMSDARTPASSRDFIAGPHQ